MEQPKYARGYNKDFLNWWYFEGGALTRLFGTGTVEGGAMDMIKKANADYEWDSPTSPYATYQEPVFAAKVEMWLATHTELYRLLPKTTFLAEGDSMKYSETELSGLVKMTRTSTPFASMAVESAPTVVDIEQMKPGYYSDPWKINWMSRVESGWQRATDPKTDPAFIKNYHTERLPHLIDALLTLDVDNAFVANDVMSLDTICSVNSEAATTYVSDAGDPDLFFGKAAAEVDRSLDTDDTFGCGAGNADTAMIGAGTNARVLKLDFIDDALAAAKPYSANKRYIIVTGNKTINEMQSLVDPKQRFLNTPMDYQQTLNGVSTRKGVEAGFTVGGIISNGLSIPVFGCDHMANETSTNRSATITDSDIGNIYILDMDSISLRLAVPVTYLETPPTTMLDMDYFQSRHMYLWAAQLLASNYRSNAVVKYLKAA